MQGQIPNGQSERAGDVKHPDHGSELHMSCLPHSAGLVIDIRYPPFEEAQ